MSKTISLTIPYEPDALSMASTMLLDMARLLEQTGGAPASSPVVLALAEQYDAEQLHASDETQNQAADDGVNPVPAEMAGTVGLDGQDREDPGLPVAGPDTRVDGKGVLFDGKYCAAAADPFYAAGKYAGQWKKKRGVYQSTYDAWHAAEVQALYETATAGAVDGALGIPAGDTAAAFAPDDAQPEQAKPQTVGEFMGWVAERQAAETLTQADIDGAYAACQLTVNMLFPPTNESTVAGHISRLLAALGA